MPTVDKRPRRRQPRNPCADDCHSQPWNPRNLGTRNLEPGTWNLEPTLEPWNLWNPGTCGTLELAPRQHSPETPVIPRHFEIPGPGHRSSAVSPLNVDHAFPVRDTRGFHER